MGVMDYFKPVSTWSAKEVREFIDREKIGDYNLIDVRQPVEYEKGHLPGARLIPVGQLSERTAELDHGKITITYCTAGVRSRAAASILERAGFREVHSMAGGINAWQGLVAEGFPEAGIEWFGAARTVGELITLARVLEEGTKMFYSKMEETLAGRDETALFRELAAAEERHIEMLSALLRDMTGTGAETVLPKSPERRPGEKIMEGGMRLDDALSWSKGKASREILELSISLEASSFDRFLAMRARVTGENSMKVFSTLADEEKCHLGKLTVIFEKLFAF